MRDKIKSFLTAQGMIKGHSWPSPRGLEHDLPILRLEDNTHSMSESRPTPTLSLYPDEARVGLVVASWNIISAFVFVECT
jgi:hypothetical protein